jgi:nitroreductase
MGLVVPRDTFPPEERDKEALADEMSVAFAMENLFVAARAKGLATVPTVFHWFDEPALRERFRIPDEVRIPIITPLGHPTEFPSGLPPHLKALRRPWRTLVHDDAWGNPRA